jgi:hypothetical protein
MGTSMTEIQESANRWAALAVLLFVLDNLLHALALLGGPSMPASFYLEISLFVLGATYSIAFFAIDCWPERTAAENESA